MPEEHPTGAEITDYVTQHPEEGCYYKVPAVQPTACTLPAEHPEGAVFEDWMVTDEGACYYKVPAVQPQLVSSGKYVKLLSYSYPECEPS